jgi:hypothetical protein
VAKQSQEVTNATTKLNVENLVKDLNALSNTVDENNKTYYVVFVSKEEFVLIRTLVFGFAGMILVAFATAMIKLLIR